MLTNLAGDPALEAKRLEFEVLISDLSARFVNLPAGQVDREIEDALGRVRAFFDVDRCGLLEILRGRKGSPRHPLLRGGRHSRRFR